MGLRHANEWTTGDRDWGVPREIPDKSPKAGLSQSDEALRQAVRHQLTWISDVFGNNETVKQD